jgi:UDP:flavonoid glycosyltransferase YjiC (YdhE family)
MNSKRILITPLNWGLGHATRCIPVIRLLLQLKHKVFIASDGVALDLLRKEFPELTFFELPGYNITYSKTSAWLSTLLHTSKILKVIELEHQQTEIVVSQNSIEVIISDNRYGCWSKNTKSIFISHHLNLPMPKGLGWVQGAANAFLKKKIKKFNEIWIPDNDNREFSGTLSHTNLPVTFVGILSRFKKVATQQQKIYRLAVVLSGPEPQRTLLEKIVLPQVIALNVPTIFVRGLLNEKMGESEIINYLTSDELENVLNQSEIVIGRSGYSTVMDLAVLGKKAIFIPTPGQPEQEYLSEKLMQARIALSVQQKKFELTDTLELSLEYSGFGVSRSNNLLMNAIEDL